MSPSQSPANGLRAFVRTRAALLQVDADEMGSGTRAGTESRAWILGVGGAAVLWFALAALVVPYIADDAMILFRHVKHLLEGHGAIWDPILPYEAHSSPLWVFLIAGLAWLGASLPTASVALGIAASSASMALLVAVTRGLGPLWLRLGLVAVITTNPPVTTWTNAGLEMPLALFVVIAFVASIGRLWRGGSRGAQAVLVACCLASAAIRPDLPLQLGACALALCLFPGAPRRALLVGVASIVTGALVLALWRMGYYGDYIALPQRAKSVIEPINVLRYGRYLLHHSPLMIAVGAAVAALWLWRPMRPRPLELGAILLAGAIMGEHALLGGDELSRGRFTIQPLALLTIALVRPLAALGLPSARLGIAIAAILLAQVALSLRPLPDGDHLCGAWREEVGLWLAAHTTEDFSIASVSAGYIPYYAERPAVDLMGLTHPEMARLDVVRGTPEYGREVAHIAAGDGVCGFIVPVCGSVADPTCPLPPHPHKLMTGIRLYLESSPDYRPARVELESKRHLILYVRESCAGRIRDVRYCDGEPGLCGALPPARSAPGNAETA